MNGAQIGPSAPFPEPRGRCCGLDRSLIEFDDDFWHPADGPRTDGAGNPPDRFDNPFDRGTIARTGPFSAVVSSGGVRVELARLDERPDLIPCR